MFNKVLVPLDGSELAEAILPYVERFAASLGSRVMLLTVIDPDDAAPAAGRQGETGNGGIGAALSTAAKERLTALTKRLVDHGVSAAFSISTGIAAEEIVRVAEAERCDIIAMATHGRNMLGRGVLGSVTDKVLHSASVPVLTINPRESDSAQNLRRAEISKVIVPLDGSELAERALPFGEEIAGRMSLELELVRIVRIGASPYMGTVYSPPVYFDEVLQGEAKAYLAEVAKRVAERGLKVNWKVFLGHPSGTLVDYARETRDEIIVMTTDGRSGLTKWILGSVAESVVRHTGDAVLIVPS
ncbi:MAG: universal stress protein [SAR202 cluster bacterium]|nr:universal stress protein [SAR202 cluster bacterium]